MPTKTLQQIFQVKAFRFKQESVQSLCANQANHLTGIRTPQIKLLFS